MQYFVHNGYIGWSYGAPGNPQLITSEDAAELMERAGLSYEEVRADFPPALFAEEDEPLYRLFGGNRFLQYGEIEKCADIKKAKISNPLKVNWNEI